MSHVTKIETVILDVDSLEQACRNIPGLHFVRGKEGETMPYAWWGYSVGDYPLPAGFTKEDLGKCTHKITCDGAQYEIGVCKSKTGKGYVLLFDFYAQHKLLETIGGEKAHKLTQEYGLCWAEKQARKLGYRTQRQPAKNGAVNVVCRGRF